MEQVDRLPLRRDEGRSVRFAVFEGCDARVLLGDGVLPPFRAASRPQPGVEVIGRRRGLDEVGEPALSYVLCDSAGTWPLPGPE